MRLKFCFVAALVLWASFSAFAQQETVTQLRDYTGGGLCLKQQQWISVLSNYLYISREKVRTEYKLANESNKPVKVELEFPIPVSPQIPAPSVLPYTDFKVWINGDVFPCPVELRAYVSGRDITDLLNKFKIPIEGYDEYDYPIDHLPKEQRDHLVEVGAVYPPVTNSPGLHYARQWTIKKRYHWIQNFPARASLNIVHEYTPDYDYNDMVFLHKNENHTYSLTPFGERQGCIDKKTINALVKLSKQKNGDAIYRTPTKQINYNLTSVDTFKMPIKNFELIIEKDFNEIVTFCWDYPISRTSNNTFQSKIKNFTPTQDLTLFFLKP